MRRWLGILAVVALPLSAGEVRVFAAASLSDALEEIARGYRGDRLVFNFGASSVLARQIEHGAPADVFLSADEAKMDQLQRLALIDVSSRVSVLSNRLVVVGPSSGRRPPSPRAAGRRAIDGFSSIAIAEPNSVPAGIYARQWLQSIGAWDPRKIVPTENVRGALAAVEAGNVDAAIVYKTDARISRRVRVVQEVINGPRISYPFAVTKDAENRRGARNFLAHLRSPAARTIFARHGFILLQ
jgi:molybdate transport system substrate-binding protein